MMQKLLTPIIKIRENLKISLAVYIAFPVVICGLGYIVGGYSTRKIIEAFTHDAFWVPAIIPRLLICFFCARYVSFNPLLYVSIVLVPYMLVHYHYQDDPSDLISLVLGFYITTVYCSAAILSRLLFKPVK